MANIKGTQTATEISTRWREDDTPNNPPPPLQILHGADLREHISVATNPTAFPRKKLAP